MRNITKKNVLLAATVLYAMGSLILAMQAIASYKSFESHPSVDIWVDPLPFWALPQFTFIFSIGGLLFCIWMLYIWKTHNMKPITVGLVVLLLLGVIAAVPQAQGSTDYVIHVLGVGDEEFDAYYPFAWWSRYLGWEIYIYDCFNRMHNEFGLTFELVGWISYDSDDNEYCFYERLQEAISETGFEFHVTQFEGHIIDLLMVFNGQAFDCSDISIPFWYAMLLCHSPEYPRTSYLCHAFSHQFYVEHCTSRGSCCMYPNWEVGLYFPAEWCQTCKNSLKYGGHYNRFTYYNGGYGWQGIRGSAGRRC